MGAAVLLGVAAVAGVSGRALSLDLPEIIYKPLGLGPQLQLGAISIYLFDEVDEWHLPAVVVLSRGAGRRTPHAVRSVGITSNGALAIVKPIAAASRTFRLTVPRWIGGAVTVLIAVAIALGFHPACAYRSTETRWSSDSFDSFRSINVRAMRSLCSRR